ncbi:ribose-5-phosphate isomerase RpiA [Flavobacteriaceae bacterium TP-CH-4]|uniref:Ribose-5-phosphate isomerase A n=1 Tax=Pelagihabitans pacificus TaxID=2696054 RepID=A0A967ECM7_9FLAO|nr:ribose-5-phosphate isomerase RpiA [Pelagihabitans pacificus]NHF58443.1 ribose-5-phosphate isomerase RpiA [Pelagihabitans pacificus]
MKSTYVENEKELAAVHATAMVKNGMIVGLGSGSTSAYMIKELGENVKKGLAITGVPSSKKTAQLAQEVGIPIITLEEAGFLDINIDGADEFDTEFRLIKGGGGALLREKILADNSRFNVIIADSSKQVSKLGAYKLPLEAIPFATANIIKKLTGMHLKPMLRQTNGETYKTDENNFIVDIDISDIRDLEKLNRNLLHIPGVVETGLFLESTDIIIMGKRDKIVVFNAKESS